MVLFMWLWNMAWELFFFDLNKNVINEACQFLASLHNVLPS